MRVNEWEWDESNIIHLAEHGIGPRIVVEIAEYDDPRFREDEDEEHASSHHMIGIDRGGTIWVICVVGVDEQENRWRAITGWKADEDDKDWYWRNR